MKKFKKFIVDFFTTNLGLKALAVVLAVATVFFINI